MARNLMIVTSNSFGQIRWTEIDSKIAEDLGKKASNILTQFPKINDLEKKLEIQEEDPELAMVQKSISSNI